MGYKIILGTELTGSVRGEDDPTFYLNHTQDDYKRLLEVSQDYFTKIITGEIDMYDDRYYISAPYRFIRENLANHIQIILPDYCMDDTAISANFIYVAHPIIVQKSSIVRDKYEYADVDGGHRFVAARGSSLLKLLVYINGQ